MAMFVNPNFLSYPSWYMGTGQTILEAVQGRSTCLCNCVEGICWTGSFVDDTF